MNPQTLATFLARADVVEAAVTFGCSNHQSVDKVFAAILEIAKADFIKADTRGHEEAMINALQCDDFESALDHARQAGITKGRAQVISTLLSGPALDMMLAEWEREYPEDVLTSFRRCINVALERCVYPQADSKPATEPTSWPHPHGDNDYDLSTRWARAVMDRIEVLENDIAEIKAALEVGK